MSTIYHVALGHFAPDQADALGALTEQRRGFGRELKRGAKIIDIISGKRLADGGDTARVTLDKQAQWLNQYPTWKVTLQGSTDDPGSPQAQTALSQKRADAVRDYLASLGIAPQRVLAKGYGREKIGDDCPEIECKAQNRRVVTNLQDNPEF